MAGKRTMRRTTCAPRDIPVDMEFSDVVRYSYKHDDGSREVAVSSVDFLLEDCDAFILNNISNGYGTNCHSGNLNKHGLWETIINELESTCISKTVRSHKYHEKSETVYTVPVVGHKVFLPPTTNDDFELGMYNEMPQDESNQDASGKLTKSTLKRIKRNPAQFLFWDGKYFDATKVYMFKPEQSNYLQPIGDYLAPRAGILTPHGPSQGHFLDKTDSEKTSRGADAGNKHPPIVEFVKNMSYHNAQHQRVHHNCRILHEGSNNNCGNYYSGTRLGCWEQLNPSDYIEINLGYPRCVTHIGTAGEFPQTSVFPSTDTVGRARIRKLRTVEESLETHVLSQKGNGVKLRKFAQHVLILKDDEFALSWVTAYEVHYRNTVTNKWTLLAVIPANTDAFSEHILDLSPYFNAKDGLFTQYLRLKPVEYHNKPRMRVSVYGVDRAAGAPVAGGGVSGEKASDGHTASSSRAAEDVPTITYAITDSTAHNAARYVRDGLRAYYYVDEWHYNLLYKERALRKQEFQKMIVQQDKTGDV